MTSPAELPETTYFNLLCRQEECGRPSREIGVRAESIDVVTISEDAETGALRATAQVDLLPVRLIGKQFCSMAECCMGVASNSTTRPEVIALLQQTATRARFEWATDDGTDWLFDGDDDTPLMA